MILWTDFRGSDEDEGNFLSMMQMFVFALFLHGEGFICVNVGLATFVQTFFVFLKWNFSAQSFTFIE